jgi:hypothetical protein
MSAKRVKNYNIVYFRIQDCTCRIFLRCETLTFSTKFVLTWLFCLKFNLSKTIHFLTRTWFLYVLTKYQAMFKVLQWNASLWKIPTLKIAPLSPRNSIFIVHASNPQYRYWNTTKSIKFGLQITLIYLTSITNFNYSIPFSMFHNTTKWKERFPFKWTTFVYVLCSD